MWTSTDAIGAYCLKCKQKLIYSLQNPKAIARHMEKYHKDILKEEIKRKNDAKIRLNPFLAKRIARGKPT